MGFLAILAVSAVLAVIKGLLASYVNVPFFTFTIILSSIFSALVLKFTPLGIKAKNMGGSIVSARQSGIDTVKTDHHRNCTITAAFCCRKDLRGRAAKVLLPVPRW